MMSLLYALTAGSTLFLSFLILTNPRKVNVAANRWLAFFVFCLFSLLIDEPMFEFDIYKNHPYLLGYENLFIFLVAPTLYISVTHYTNPEKTFRKRDFLHFIPYALLFPFLVSTILLSTKEKLAFISETANIIDPVFDIATIGLIAQIVIYTFLSYLKIRKHQRDINLFTSDTSNINLNWLKNTLITIIIMVFLWIGEMPFNSNEIVSYFSAIGYFISIYVIGYYAFRQDEIFPYKETEIQEIKEIIDETPSSKVQRISDVELQNLKSRVTDLMENQKLYLDDSLSLPKLAEKVETNIHNLSYVLNEGFQENFFQYVNRHRVDEAKRLLDSQKHQQLNMLGIAFESGFSSKTTFNTTFKKVTGISPSEYIAQNADNKIFA